MTMINVAFAVAGDGKFEQLVAARGSDMAGRACPVSRNKDLARTWGAPDDGFSLL